MTATTNPALPRSTCLFIVFTGLLQGVLIHLFWVVNDDAPAFVQWLPQEALTFIRTFSLSLPPLIALGLVQIKDKYFWRLLAVLVLIQCAMLAWTNWNATAPDIQDDLVWQPLVQGMTIFIFVALPWGQVLHTRQQRKLRGLPCFRTPYPALVTLAWRNVFNLLLAALFALLCAGVLLLWAALFDLLNITVFKDLFLRKAFALPAIGMFFALGILIARSQPKLAQMLRQSVFVVLFVVSKGLLPMVVLLAVLFIASLPFTGLTPLWQTRYATAILLGLIAFMLLLTNAAWQDGKTAAPGWRGVRLVIQAGLLTLPLYAVLALVALGLRINQYGWTSERFFGVVVALLASGYALGYARAALRSCLRSADGWLKSIGRTNKAMSWAIMVTAVLINLPVLDPHRISVSSQSARLRASAPDLDEKLLFHLRFKNGRQGYTALQTLRNHPNIAAHKTAQALIDHTLARHSRWQSEETAGDNPRLVQDVHELRAHITLAQGSSDPDDNWWQGMLEQQLEPTDCLLQSRTCIVRQTDIDGDGTPDVLLCRLSRYTNHANAHCRIHTNENGVWYTRGNLTFHINRNHSTNPGQTMQQLLEQAPLQTQPPRWPILILGDRRAKVQAINPSE